MCRFSSNLRQFTIQTNKWWLDRVVSILLTLGMQLESITQNGYYKNGLVLRGKHAASRVLVARKTRQNGGDKATKVAWQWCLWWCVGGGSLVFGLLLFFRLWVARELCINVGSRCLTWLQQVALVEMLGLRHECGGCELCGGKGKTHWRNYEQVSTEERLRWRDIEKVNYAKMRWWETETINGDDLREGETMLGSLVRGCGRVRVHSGMKKRTCSCWLSLKNVKKRRVLGVVLFGSGLTGPYFINPRLELLVLGFKHLNPIQWFDMNCLIGSDYSNLQVGSNPHTTLTNIFLLTTPTNI